MNQTETEVPAVGTGLATTLRSIVEGTASTKGEHFFDALVQYLAVALNVHTAFVAEFAESQTCVRTLSVWMGDRHVENFEFELQGTPCESVLLGEIKHFPANVQQQFPSNRMLQEIDAQSYLAVPLTEDDGSVIGHLAVIGTSPLEASTGELSIFHIFAARATAELIRRYAERALQESHGRESRLRSDRERIEAEVAYLREELRSRNEFAEIVGESDAIWKVLREIDMVASTDSTVLIHGETGTGKELVARAIHRNSSRSGGPFIKVNCGALPDSLLESELFGHEQGAFTGASQRRAGRFELADRGTIFLDEIGEMPQSAQSRLLRVLQERELERVGGSETIQIDTRVVAATNRDLEAMVQQGEFREDLFYRLNVFPMPLPSLRDRLEDIPTLVRSFLKSLGSRLGKTIDTVPTAVTGQLQRYSWPGNVRELQKVVERAMIL
ncbi:MAG: sigma 54-interacting transcriptional regulator, partial [Pirellulales bacterium]|nr:sigma 54-interacting transcriptional regulator [Pirellulales bacterium]